MSRYARWPRPQRVLVLAAMVVLGLACASTYLLTRSSAGHRGGVLTIVGGTDLWFSQDTSAFDPAFVNSEWHPMLAAMLADGLVGFRRAPGGVGNGIVADLATELPGPADGGLTYTFHVRKGVRYSTGEPVLAGDIRRGIERTVVHFDTTDAVYYSTTILGAKACRDAAETVASTEAPLPDCDLREGISADDRTGTVTFHLGRPAPDFLYRLALPAAAAVPQDTPVDLKPGTSLPGTGPYKIRSYDLGRDAAGVHTRLELVRNPHFRVWSPAAQPDGYVNRVVLETGYTADQAVARATDGRSDLVWFGATLTDLDRLRTRHGSQLHTSPRAVTNMLFLNTTEPPFDNRDARRAVAYGLDRAALTGRGDFLSGTVTCQFLPPGVAGHKPYCPFTRGEDKDGKWIGPDVTTAKALVRKSGTRGAEVVVNAHDDPALRAAGERIVALLGRLGYRATLSLREDYYAGDPSQKDWNAGLAFWPPDYLAASAILPALGSCDLGDLGYNPGRYCNAAIERQIAAANDQLTADPGSASDAWATIDRNLVDAAATIPYGNSVNHYFVSDRVGNAILHPITGPLIAQIWVQ
jgi:peptide/nickel transport system substrate-binding protein